MGGEGSGRKPDFANRLIHEIRQPILTAGREGMFIPNYGGIKDEARKDNAGSFTDILMVQVFT